MSKITKISGGGKKWLALAVLLVAAAVSTAWYYHAKTLKAASGTAESTANGASDDDAVEVATVRLSKGGIMKTSAQIGSVHPYQEADLYAKVSGYLSVLNVDYGSRVEKDQLLAEIDDPEIVKEAERAAADVLQAKAAVGQAEAFIESAKADRDASGSTIEQSKAEVDRYVAMRSYHEKKLARYRELVKNKAIPQQLADEEEENYESTRAAELASQKAVLKSRADFTASVARVKKAEADLAEARANVQVAEAKLAKAEVLVAYTKIRAPYQGVITKRNFFPGAFIRSAAEGGTIPLLTVSRIDKVRIVTAIPDRDVPWTHIGDPAEITLDALPGQVFKGQVSRFADAEDPSSRTMHTEVDLPNPGDKLRPGMYGIAKIILDTSTKGATLPAKCLIGESKGGKADLFVIKDGKAKKVRVAIGADDGLRVEVLSGISPEDDVILDTGRVTEGAPVRALPAAPNRGPAE